MSHQKIHDGYGRSAWLWNEYHRGRGRRGVRQRTQQHVAGALGATDSYQQHVKQQHQDGCHSAATQFDDANVPAADELRGKTTTANVCDAVPATTLPTTATAFPTAGTISGREWAVQEEEEQTR